jgi:predicted RNA-binding protein with PIN domain
MPTHLIIDGYNLLAAVERGRSLPFETAREALLRDLAAYRQRKGHALTVVFDAWQRERGIEEHEHRLGVHVIYSKRGERADQIIQRLAQDHGRDCAVVSSDREVRHHAEASGALVLEAREFAEKLQALSPSRTAHKELDVSDEKGPPRGPGKPGNPRKLPKALRRRSRQLKRF